MFLSISLYIALIIFAAGLVYKVSRWFRESITIGAESIPFVKRVLAGFKGIVLTLFSVRVFTLFKVFILDVILQRRILREDFLRWLMHMCLYAGFMLLLLMHALGRYTSASLFDNYYSTLNPFLFLRDLFGIMVLVGAAIAIYRRFIAKLPRLTSKPMDTYIIVMVVVIIISGFFLEGTKITSHTVYNRMVKEYADLENSQESKALEAYCAKEYGVVLSERKDPYETRLLEQGRKLYEMNCAECHANPRWAFVGYGVAAGIRPFARGIDKANAHGILWFLHFFACLIALAYFPFSKFFHVFVSPLGLLANAVMETGKSDLANIATKQMMELDACTHCSTCSFNCSVGFLAEEIPNQNILPSEKMVSLKALASGRKLENQELRDLQEGVFLCTNCNRCTVVCPVGINLQELWFNARETLLRRGLEEFSVLSPLSYYRGLRKDEIKEYEPSLIRVAEAFGRKSELLIVEEEVLPTKPGFRKRLSLSAQASTFSVCFGCQTCSNSCPVVASYENPQESLGLLPHQIMHACALGLRGLIMGTNMLWDCLGCYQCQERCPQGVCITDVLYELKNLAIELARDEIK
jgi:heterodisulfide reductase subunit C/nitrate reductase gamma subunit